MKFLSNLFLLTVLLAACDTSGQLELDKVKDPEKAMSQLYDGFDLESLTKEDVDYDGNMDFIVSGYNLDGDFVEGYFIHNGDINTSYTYSSADDYWDEYEYGEETVSAVEDYFSEFEYDSKLEDITYHDLNGDGIDDAIAIAFYSYDDYQSIDAYVFIGNEEGYIYHGLSEVHYPISDSDFSAFSAVVVEDEYFTVELGQDSPYWRRYITYRYDETEGEFILHKDGGIVKDENGEVVRDEVLSEADFGLVYFVEFTPDGEDVFSLRREARVSNLKELLNALSSNMTIYLEENVYALDDLAALPNEIQEAYKDAGNWEDFYASEFYMLSCGHKDYGVSIQLRLKNLNNVDLIGEGSVEIIVRDEMSTVLSFENCENMLIENLYMVHDVGGICGADVVDLENCYDLAFYQCVFDGSGELGVYASQSYGLYFEECDFTNCTSGALEFYDSDATYDRCNFNDNEIWNALIYAYSYSSLDFYACNFYNNQDDDTEDYNATTYMFLAEDDSYIYVDVESKLNNNRFGKLLNDKDFVDIQ